MGGKFVDAPADGDPRRASPRALSRRQGDLLGDARSRGQSPASSGCASRPSSTTSTSASCARCSASPRPGRCGSPRREFKVNALGFLCAAPRRPARSGARSSRTCITRTGTRASSTARYGVFMTGPSATADIEGVLIHGAQGIRTLTVILCGRDRMPAHRRRRDSRSSPGLRLGHDSGPIWTASDRDSVPVSNCPDPVTTPRWSTRRHCNDVLIEVEDLATRV